MEERDLLLARQLQEQFDKESTAVYIEDDKPISHTGSSKVPASNTQSGLSVIDPVWETTDPNPDVHALFLQYDEQYFWGRLKGVEVKWSPRMTLCAGVCSYEGRGGLCSIRLSVPLLKLRPRKDLVETLLHEMIHAFLFVTENDRDRDGHGPNFKKHMHRINKASGSKITIYHDFHDEVDNYRQHWWRCDGPCRNSRPYYGWVKRSMNRAPSAQDFWWAEHQKKCGGTYTKVKEPEGYGQKKKGGGKDDKQSKTEKKNTSPDIRTFFGNGQVLGSSGQTKGATGSGADASKKKTTSTILNGILTKTPTGSNSGSDKNTGNATGAGKSKGGNPNAAKGMGRGSGADSNKGNNPSASTSKTNNSNMPQLPSLSGDNNLDAAFDLPFDLDDWDGGIWSSQEDGPPGRNVEKETGIKNSTSTQGKSEVAKQKTWTVLETDADQQKKDAVSKGKTWTAVSTDNAVNEKGADKSGGGSNGLSGGGNVLGSKSAHGLSWLARMRKQWAKDEENRSNEENSQNSFSVDTESPPPAPCLDDFHDDFSETKQDNALFSSPVSNNDSSVHDSFHVSSCEIDEWPSPEKYDDKDNTASQSNRKRTVVELSSSDEESSEKFNFNSSKRPKPSQQTSSSSSSSAGSEKENVSGESKNNFQKVKGKNTNSVIDVSEKPGTLFDSPRSKSNSNDSYFVSDAIPKASSVRSDRSGASTSQTNNGRSGSGIGTSSSQTNSNNNGPESVTGMTGGGQGAVGGSMVECPSCMRNVPAAAINDHLDTCLS